MSLYQGETPKYLVRIKDANGVQLDPSNVAQVVEVKIWIYNSITGESIAKFVYPTSPSAGWRAATIKVISGEGKRLLFILTEAETEAAKGNSNIIQIQTIFYDDENPPSNARTEIKKGQFDEIKSVQ